MLQGALSRKWKDPPTKSQEETVFTRNDLSDKGLASIIHKKHLQHNSKRQQHNF